MRRTLLAAASLCLLTAAACASRTDGSGTHGLRSVVGAPSAPDTSYYGSYAPLSNLPGSPTSVLTTDPEPVQTGPVTVSRLPSSAPPSAASSTRTSAPPPAAAPPPVCRAGGCTRNRQAAFDAGYSVVLWTGVANGGASSWSVLELAYGSRPVWWQATADRIGDNLACAPRPVPNCVVVDGAGAHASVATGYVRRGAALVRTATVESDTPTTDPADLDHDGLLDVVTAINTYQPTYATGTVYWQTFRSTGTGFRSTGCTAPQHTLAPEPTRLLTGACPR